MPIFAWIMVTTLLGGILSVSCAAVFAMGTRPSRVPMLISYAVGAMLGAVFLEILPEALERASSVQSMAMTLLAGIMLFFLLEKFVLWRHCHEQDCEAHDPPAHPHSPSPENHASAGAMILVGDTVHNFVDGIIVAAAFMADVELGVVTALAIIAHEIPQEVGDFLILLHSGYSRGQALAFNLLSSLATVLGGGLAYWALQDAMAWIPSLLGLAAASMLYVAVADLIPGLHRRINLVATLQQSSLIALGIASIWGIGFLTGHH